MTKHNKKRNTAFLYEILVRELTKAAMHGDTKRKSQIVKIIKTSFRKGTALAEDLDQYKALSETDNLPKPLAYRLLDEAKSRRSRIASKQLFNEQTSLISTINKILGPDAFRTFVPNYKDLASIYQIFSETMPSKKRIFLEEALVVKMTVEEQLQEEKMVPISKLAYKTFIKRFNSDYSQGLLKEQQDLLGAYVLSFHENAVGLKVYLNEEIARLKKMVAGSLKLSEVIEDAEMVKKTQSVLDLLESFSTTPIDKTMVESVLKIQQLAHEVQND